MTVICPSCEARFRDPPAEVSRNRPMQCGRCEHEWLLKREDNQRTEITPPSMVPDMADIIDSPDSIHTKLPVAVGKVSEAPKETERPKRQPIYVDRAPEQPKKASLGVSKPILALTCVAALAGSLIFKDAIMAEFPQTKNIYATAGLVTENPDLEIANIVTTKSSKDGINQLIVKGEIQNLAKNDVAVPPLKLTMRGEKNADLYAWTVSAAKNSLKAGEKSRFTAVAHNFPKDAVNVEVEFIPSAK